MYYNLKRMWVKVNDVKSWKLEPFIPGNQAMFINNSKLYQES